MVVCQTFVVCLCLVDVIGRCLVLVFFVFVYHLPFGRNSPFVRLKKEKRNIDQSQGVSHNGTFKKVSSSLVKI